MRSLRVDVAKQSLYLLENDQVVDTLLCSTARLGVGERKGSEQTPRGWHRVRAMVGANQPKGTVYIGRRPTGEVWSQSLADHYPDRDWILTRILWLCGMEPGLNRFGEVDSMQRYIYIHGTPPTEPMGVPRSHGCIRLHDDEIIDVFSFVRPGSRVLIQA